MEITKVKSIMITSGPEFTKLIFENPVEISVEFDETALASGQEWIFINTDVQAVLKKEETYKKLLDALWIELSEIEVLRQQIGRELNLVKDKTCEFCTWDSDHQITN